MTTIPTITLDVDRDGVTGNIQVSISSEDGSGFRLAGPKYNGSSKSLVKIALTQHEADEIRSYLDYAFPQ